MANIFHFYEKLHNLNSSSGPFVSEKRTLLCEIPAESVHESKTGQLLFPTLEEALGETVVGSERDDFCSALEIHIWQARASARPIVDWLKFLFTILSVKVTGQDFGLLFEYLSAKLTKTFHSEIVWNEKS